MAANNKELIIAVDNAKVCAAVPCDTIPFAIGVRSRNPLYLDRSAFGLSNSCMPPSRRVRSYCRAGDMPVTNPGPLQNCCHAASPAYVHVMLLLTEVQHIQPAYLLQGSYPDGIHRACCPQVGNITSLMFRPDLSPPRSFGLRRICSW